MERFFTAHEAMVLAHGELRCEIETAVVNDPSLVPASLRRTKRSRLVNPTRLSKEGLCIHLLELLCATMVVFDEDALDEASLEMLWKKLPTTFRLTKEEVRFLRTKLCKNIFLQINKMRRNYRSLLHKNSLPVVIGFYRQLMKPMMYEKKNKGMVFTPFERIDLLLDRLPSHVWTNPHNTFLDPSAGMGGFLLKIYERLMKSLVRKFPEEGARKKHILSHMLFAVELDEVNVGLLRQVFGPDLSLYDGDALAFDPWTAFGRRHFTVVVGNPPFEGPQIKDVARNAGASLWPKFVNKALTEWMEPAGCFAMLLPPGWRKPNDRNSRTTSLLSLMTVNNKLTFLEVYDAKSAKEAFEGNVAIQFDLVNIEGGRSSRQHETSVKGVGSTAWEKVKLYGMPFIPNGHLSFWKRLLLGAGSKDAPRCKVHHSRSALGSDKWEKVRQVRSEKFVHPVVHALHRNGESRIVYSATKPREGGFGISKVIFNEYGGWNPPMMDRKGRFGMTQDAFCLEISSRQEGEQIVRFFTDVNVLKMFNEDLKWGTSVQHVFWKLFHFLPRDFYQRF